MRRSFKFLLRPTSKQVIALTQMLRDHCSLYSGALLTAPVDCADWAGLVLREAPTA